MEDNKLPYLNSFEQAVNLIDFSLRSIENWDNDILILEELLRINHRGWELFFKTYKHLFSEKMERGHSLIKLIESIEKNDLIWFELQNMRKLFETDLYRSYFELLDNLFNDTASRYANINDIIGVRSKHCIVDQWLTNHDLIKNLKTMYSDIKSIILEINHVSLRLFAMHFSYNENSEYKLYTPYFIKIGCYKYWNDKFL